MSNYTPVNDFSAKDALTTGDPEKIILGSDMDNETAAIQTAVNSKYDTNTTTITLTGNFQAATITATTGSWAARCRPRLVCSPAQSRELRSRQRSGMSALGRGERP
jgi:hypothetical protein